MSNPGQREEPREANESQEEWDPGTWRLLGDGAESLLETHRQVMDSYRSGTVDHLKGPGTMSDGRQSLPEDRASSDEESR